MIRDRNDAIKALAEIMRLERREQLVRLTVFTAQCLTPETRRILIRAQEGVVAGRRLEEAAKRTSAEPAPERQAPASPAAPTPRSLQPMDENKLREEVTTAFEALNVAAMAMEVFPQLRQSFARWEVARLALHSYRNVQ